MIAPDVQCQQGGGVVVESEKWGENKIQLQDGESERQQEIG